MPKVEIRLAGHLDPTWTEWFEDFSIEHIEPDQTLLTGTVSDQAALYGLIAKLRDLGAVLIAVHYGDDPPEEFPV